MRNVRLRIAYDGSRFYGWQRQDGFVSVQETIEKALEELLGDKLTLHGAGRTDTGVHALRQVANVHLDTHLEDDRLRHALNAHLPRSVVVDRLETCRDDFHARFDARGKRYAYLTLTTRFRPPFGREQAHWVPQSLDYEAMRRAAAQLVGRHDFRAFANTGSERKSTVRRVSSLRFLARRERFAFVIQADGFLYNMVRTIAGTLIDVGRRRLDPDCVRRALASADREEVGPTAPARGLYLASVRYSEPVFPGPDRGPHGTPGLFHDRPVAAPRAGAVVP